MTVRGTKTALTGITRPLSHSCVTREDLSSWLQQQPLGLVDS